MEVLHHVHEVEPRLHAEQQRHLAQLEIEVYQQRFLSGQTVQHDREIGGQRGRAAATLCAEDCEHLSGLAGGSGAAAELDREPLERLPELLGRDRLLEVVGEACPHGREHLLG